MITENIVFEIDYGMEKYGKVVERHGKFHCFYTPMFFGGDWIEDRKIFETKKEAITYLKSLI